MNRFVDKTLSFLMVNRRLFLFILTIFLGLSALFGYLYQNSLNKQREALHMYNEAWRQMVVVVQIMQSSSNITPDFTEKVQKIFEESESTLQLLVTDYAQTVSAAMAGLLLLSLEVFLSGTPNILSYNKLSGQNLAMIQKKHPKFWRLALSFVNGINAERQGNTAVAIEQYKNVVEHDKRHYIVDHAVIAVARNYEMIQKYPEAVEWYTRIKKDYAHSLWLPIAIAKIHLLSNKA